MYAYIKNPHCFPRDIEGHQLCVSDDDDSTESLWPYMLITPAVPIVRVCVRDVSHHLLMLQAFLSLSPQTAGCSLCRCSPSTLCTAYIAKVRFHIDGNNIGTGNSAGYQPHIPSLFDSTWQACVAAAHKLVPHHWQATDTCSVAYGLKGVCWQLAPFCVTC